MHPTLTLDAAGTLIHPVEPVGEVYARHLAQQGVTADPSEMERTFRACFASAAPPDYSLHPFGHAAEHAWWQDLVSEVLRNLGGEAERFAATRLSTLDLPTFDSYFDALFSHYADPSAWALYPDVVPFLEAAARQSKLAVVSNFDDRLAPILDGLGIGPYFEHVFTSADARARKPDRAIFDLALDRLNCAPAETAHCGDSQQADFLGATNAGLRAFHLQRPRQTLHDFLEFTIS